RGATATQAEDFAAARAVIDAYLRENFEPATFTPRSTMTPLPETVVRAGTAVKIAPWLPPGTNLNDQNPLPKLVLNAEERGIDETDLPLVAYGDMLFDSPEIFGEPARSLGLACATCHNRSDINQDFFIPGISSQPGAVDVDGHFFNSIFNDHTADAIDIPSLRGIRFLGPYGRDGRIASLREFTRNVIVGEFAGAEPTPFMLDTLVAYMLEFDFLPNSRIDARGRLSGNATDAERRGEALFRRPFAALDGKACASCHIPSASFVDRRAHNIGSGSSSYGDALDGAFDTPTILGTRFTAPYFHDGSQPTLASVVGWFDQTFGLGLSSRELADLTAYVAAVGDADEPYETFDEENTAFRLAWEELTTFASTLDWLLPRRDTFHAGLLIDTVASDLAADASVMRNLAAKPDVYRLSTALADVGVAIAAERWEEAERGWAAFKSLQTELDPEMY
ncbi:MAG: cytochrome c peroxidase, partial [Alphaproteobacteria bacterium]